MSKKDMGEKFKVILENLEREKPKIFKEAKSMVNRMNKSHDEMFEVFQKETLKEFFSERGIHNPEETEGLYKIHVFRLRPEGHTYLREVFFIAEYEKTKKEAMEKPEGIFLIETSLNFAEDGVEISSVITEMEITKI